MTETAACSVCLSAPRVHHRTLCRDCNLARRREIDPDKRLKINSRKREQERSNKEHVAARRKVKYDADPVKYQEAAKKYARENPQKVKRALAAWRAQNKEKEAAYGKARLRDLQAATISAATRSGYEWTGVEMELVADADRSIIDLAFMLGRTYAAVAIRRHMVRYDPKSIAHAGLPTNA